MLAITLIGLAVATLGLALLAVGLRGRRVDDHPLCCRCGFDLFGTPDPAICNECGSDLASPRAVRVGHRQKRRGLVGVGLTLLVPAVAAIGLVGYAVATDLDWQQHKPEWFLRHELTSNDAPTADAAADELERRYRDTEEGIAAASLDALVDSVLARQADRDAAWDIVADGGLIEYTRTRGDLDDERWGRFALSAIGLHLDVRPRVRVGDPLPAVLALDFRGGPKIAFSGYATLEGATIDGKDVPFTQRQGSFNVQQPHGSFGMPTGLETDKPPEHLQVGQATVTLRGSIRVTAGGGNDLWRERAAGVDWLAETDFDLEGVAVVDPADAPGSFTLVGDTAIREALSRSVGLNPLLKDEDKEWPSWNIDLSINSQSVSLKPLVTIRPAGVGEFQRVGDTNPFVFDRFYGRYNISGQGRSFPINHLPPGVADADFVDIQLLPDIRGRQTGHRPDADLGRANPDPQRAGPGDDGGAQLQQPRSPRAPTTAAAVHAGRCGV